MYHLSDYALLLMAKQRKTDNLREAEQIRLAKMANKQDTGIITHLKKRVKQWFTTPAPNKIEPTENELILAEFLNISPEEVIKREAKRRFYERIMTGHLLGEAEALQSMKERR